MQKKLKISNSISNIDFIGSDDNVFAVGEINNFEKINYYKAPYIRVKTSDPNTWGNQTPKLWRYQHYNEKNKTYYDEGIYEDGNISFGQFYHQYDTQCSGKTYYCTMSEPNGYGAFVFIDVNSLGYHPNTELYIGRFTTVPIENPEFGLITEDSPFYPGGPTDNGIAYFEMGGEWGIRVENNILYFTETYDEETTANEMAEYTPSGDLTYSGETYRCYVTFDSYVDEEEKTLRLVYYLKENSLNTNPIRIYAGYAKNETLDTKPQLLTVNNLKTRDGSLIENMQLQANADGIFVSGTRDLTIRDKGFETTTIKGTGYKEITLEDDNRLPVYSGVTFLYDGMTNNRTIGSVDFHLISEIPSGICKNCINLSSVTFDENATSIGMAAFSGCNITSLVIPNNIENIGDYAFMGNSNLSSLTLSDSLTYIGSSVFESCSLTNLVIPDGIQSIGYCAFWNNYNLTDVTIPESVTYIDDLAFDGCSITSLNIHKNLTFSPIAFDTEGQNSLIQQVRCDLDTIDLNSIGSNFLGLTTFIIGDNTTELTNRMYNERVERLVIGNNVTSIPTNAFYECVGLTSIEIGSSVTSIGSYAFGNTPSVEDLYIPGNVTYISQHAFEECGATSITIEDGLKKIDDYAFESCEYLSSITIPDTCEYIGYEVFNNCSSLTEIDIPEGVTYLSKYFMSSSPNVKSITIPSTIQNQLEAQVSWYSLDTGQILDKLTLNCSGVTINNGNLPGKIKVLEVGPNVQLGNGTSYELFKNKGLEKVILHDGVKLQAGNIFSDNSNLTSVTLPNDLTVISGGSFMYCTSLTSIDIPGTVTQIGSTAFLSCSSLSSVTLNSGLQIISSQAFSSCQNLTEITIPDTVVSIAEFAFAGSDNLTIIYYSGTATGAPWGASNAQVISN